VNGWWQRQLLIRDSVKPPVTSPKMERNNFVARRYKEAVTAGYFYDLYGREGSLARL
jgi:hypothetical protein